MNATRFLPRRSAAAEQRLRAGAACLWDLTHFRPWYTARVLPLAVRVGSRSTDYHPRIASQTVVHQVVRDHFETFRAQAAGWRNGEGLPRFVEAEFRNS